jgi:hypothetical protein
MVAVTVEPVVGLVAVVKLAVVEPAVIPATVGADRALVAV